MGALSNLDEARLVIALDCLGRGRCRDTESGVRSPLEESDHRALKSGGTGTGRIRTLSNTIRASRAAIPGRRGSSSGNDIRETVSADFYAGARLWQGAEAHADGLMWQGFGLSKTLWVEGFPNGEAFRLGTDSGETRVRPGRGKRGHRGRSGYRYLAATSQRSARIPLAARHLQSRRCSAPRLGPIVAGGPNPYPGLRGGPSAAGPRSPVLRRRASRTGRTNTLPSPAWPVWPAA